MKTASMYKGQIGGIRGVFLNKNEKYDESCIQLNEDGEYFYRKA